MVKHEKNENWEKYDEFKKKEILQFIKKAKEVLNGMRSAYHKEQKLHSGYAIRHMTLLLILKQLLNESYRGLIGWVESSKEVQEKIGLKSVPHYAYLQQVSKKIEPKFFKEFFKEFREEHGELKLAADATGFSSSFSSSYYTRKIKGKQKRKDFVKLHALADVRTQLITSAKVTGGLKHESPVFREMLKKLPEDLGIAYVTADKAYDAKDHHKTIQTKFKAKSVIKVKENNISEKTRGRYRRKTKEKFSKGSYEEKYGERNKIETVFSVIKRVMGATLRARKFITQKIELLFRLVAYNIRRLVLLERQGTV